MNKLFTKIVGAALGLTMAIGVGVAVASNREAVPVSAATNDVYELVTAADQISDGDTVIFVNQAETYASSTTQNGNNRGMVAITGVSNHQYTIKNTEAVQEYAVVEGATSGQFGFHTGTGFLNATGGTSNNYLTSAECDATAANVSGTRAWTLSASNNVFTVLNSSKNSSGTYYYLAFNGTTIFSAYRSGQSKPYIYKKLATQTVTSSSGEFEVEVGNTITLSSNATTTVTWSSANSSIASVNESTGVVTGVAGGSTTITASASGYAPKTVTVTVTSSVPFISLDKSTITDVFGETASLTATFGSLGGTLTWKTSDSSIAGLSSTTGATISVSLLKVGTATVTAFDSANEATVYASCSITINDVPCELDVTISNFTEITTSYADYTHTYSGLNDLNGGLTASVTIKAHAYKNANGIQVGSGQGGFINNTTAFPGRITSITATFTASGKNISSMYAAKDSAATTSSTKIGDGSTSDTEQTFDFSDGNYNYFYFDLSNVTGACYYSLHIEFGNLAPEVTSNIDSATIYTSGTTSAVATLTYSNFTNIEDVSVSSSDTSVIPVANCVLTNSNQTLTITQNGVDGSSTITVEAIDSDLEVYSCDIAITVVDNSITLTKIEVTNEPDNTVYTEGDTLDLTGLVVTATFSDESTDIVTTSCEFLPDDGDVLSTTDDEVLISYTYAGVEKETSFEITVNAYVAGTYTKVTTAPQDYRGTYLFVYEDATSPVALNPTVASFNAANNTISVSISSNSITGSRTIDACSFEVMRDDDGNYRIRYTGGESVKYLGAGSGSIALNSSKTATTLVTFKNIDEVWFNDAAYLRFNTGWPGFRGYTEGKQTAVALYKLDVTSAINTEVSNFVSGFDTALGNSVCKTDGTTVVSDVNSAWTSQATAFAALSVDAQGILANTTYTHNAETKGTTADIVDRYDYIYSKYSESLTKGDFMNRSGLASYQATGAANSRIALFDVVASNATGTTIIVIVSLIGLTAIGGYFFIRKRKEQ